jgi:hypothetical protein
MKDSILIAAVLLSMGLTLPAAIFQQGTVFGSTVGSVANSTIRDGNVNGTVNSMNLSAAGLDITLTDIQVTLNVSGGGYNGDLYAYLSYNGVLVPLLNRIGVSSGNSSGDPGQGLNNVTLSDTGSANIHTFVAGNLALSGTYQPDGFNISPLSSAASFNANGGSISLDGVGTGFGGQDPNGVWVLFIADVVAGGGNQTLNGWILNITAVPEPVNLAIALFAAALAGHGVIRRRFTRSKLRPG